MYVCVIVTFFPATSFHPIESILMCSIDNLNKSFCFIDFYSKNSPRERSNSKFCFSNFAKDIPSLCFFKRQVISTCTCMGIESSSI